MSYYPYPQRDPKKDYFPLPNEIFDFSSEATLHSFICGYCLACGIRREPEEYEMQTINHAEDTYAHATNRMQEEAAEKMGNFMAQIM